MKFTLYLHPVKIKEWGLTMSEAVIFSFCYELPSWATPINIDGENYYFGDRGKASEETGIELKEDTVYRVYKSLSEKGLIVYKKHKHMDLISVTEKGRTWNLYSDLNPKNSEKNPKKEPKLGKKSESHIVCYKETSSYEAEEPNSPISLKEKTGHGVEPQSEDGVAVSVDYTLRDEEINQEIIDEVLWRLDNEYSSSELFGMFGDDCDLVAEKQFLAERWASGDKEMVKHPKSNRKRDLKYQSCLKGFKRWVESYASKRSKVPVSDRKIRTSHQQDEVDYVLLKKTAIAHGAPTFDRWWERMGRKSGQWKLDEELLMQFHKMFGTLEEKQKYLIYSLHKKPTIHPTYPDKDLNIVLKNIVRDGFMDKAVILESDGYFKEREWIGRPVSLYQYPPEYYPVKMPQCDRDSIMSMVPKGYYDACDRKYPPVYMYLDGIRLKKDNPYANIKPVDSQTYLKNDK